MSDIYCAICCGPLVEVSIASKPRSEAFKTAHQCGDDSGTDDSGTDEDIRGEERSYDCEIITREEAAWTTTMMLLGFNPKALTVPYSTITIADARFSVAFLAPFGTYESDSAVAVEDSPDGSFTLHDVGNETNYFECYDVYGDDCPNKEPAFPFHPPCYWILQRRLSDRFGGDLSTDGLATMDKDVLYKVMRSLTMVCYLDIDYGDLDSDLVCLDYWHSNAGEEVYAANPGLVEGLEERIQKMMATGYFRLHKRAELDLNHGVRKDPFRGLPFDILVIISEQLEDPECLMNWARASWSIHTLVRSAQDSFWKRTIRMQMRWFFELHKCLENDALCRGSSMRAVFLWAAGGSELRFGMKGGDFLRLANRRRIWTSPCKDLTDQYYQMLPHHFLGEGGGDYDYNKDYSSEEEEGESNKNNEDAGGENGDEN
ncbi:hypothetical protein VE03_10209 [Pseudogymnoascus sp. 23342-1-I1]|nr:hypothetical protein VE03_10209 [Pseudogymnoascus sp. 23342-1-I1]